MSTPATETARRTNAAPEPVVAAPRFVSVAAVPRRQALQERRRRIRRQRRVYAWGSLAALAGLLATTIVVLDLVR